MHITCYITFQHKQKMLNMQILRLALHSIKKKLEIFIMYAVYTTLNNFLTLEIQIHPLLN